MGNTVEWAEASFVAENFDLLGPGDDISYFGPGQPGNCTLGPDQFLLALNNGCAHSYAIMGTKEELRTALQVWLRDLGDEADSERELGYPLRTLVEVLKEYGARLGDEDAGLDRVNDEGKYLLVERHTGLAVAEQPYWFSRHTSVRAAREYNANQGCAEDWEVDSIFELTPERVEP